VTAGTEYVLIAVVCGGLGLLLSIGYNLKRIAAALESIAAREDSASADKPE
jgi:hypothetical protein